MLLASFVVADGGLAGELAVTNEVSLEYADQTPPLS
jgi:hypothetical protein